MFAIVSHLYRKSAQHATSPLLAIFLLFTLVAAQAQRPEMRRPQSDDAPPPSAPAKKSKRGPRAIAVIEMLPGGATRLVPVALWMDGKYYDASLYGANPEPFVLQPGTVYEAQNYGETAGTFVVKMPKLVGGNWIGDGQWKPYGSLDAKIAADAAKHPKPKPKDSKAVFTGGPDEGPPVLHRVGGSDTQPKTSTSDKTSTTASSQAPASTGPGTTQSTQAQGSGTAQGTSGNTAGSTNTSGNTSGSTTSTSSSKQPSSTDGSRPTLKRPSDPDESSTSSSSSSSSDDGSVTVSDPNRPVMHRAPAPDSGTSASADDPDRPVIHRSAPATETQQASAPTAPVSSPSSDDNDPDRPLLSHSNKPAAPSGKSATAPATTAKSATPPSVAASTQKPAPGTAVRLYPAISDAGSYANRSFLYPMTPDDKQQKTPAVLALALAEIRAFASKRPGPQIPKTAAITDYDLRGFDLDFSNTPTLVLTAKLPVASTGSKPFVYYATVVARIDINGDPQKVFTSVTDTTHLDAYPRMELVDALDADANGRGDLLFRQYSDTGINYGLYRVFPYNMEKVFEGGTSL